MSAGHSSVRGAAAAVDVDVSLAAAARAARAAPAEWSTRADMNGKRGVATDLHTTGVHGGYTAGVADVRMGAFSRSARTVFGTSAGANSSPLYPAPCL